MGSLYKKKQHDDDLRDICYSCAGTGFQFKKKHLLERLAETMEGTEDTEL